MNPERKRKKRVYDSAYYAAHQEERNAYAKAYYAAHPEKKKDYDKRRRYGISLDEFVALFEKQGHRCAICYTDKFGRRAPTVDHDHSTGKIRGILCNNCNRALGLMGDSPVRLRKAIKYLETREGGLNTGFTKPFALISTAICNE